MNASTRVSLQNADFRLLLDPWQGGAIREFTWRGREVLRSAPAAASDPFQLACFPLVPYVNRIVEGRFNAGGTAVKLAPNWSEDPHPLHGQGWRAPWCVVEALPATVILEFLGGGDEWPWQYRARQRFELRPDGLLLSLAIENLAGAPMPAALGLHPYFPDAAHAQLYARTERVWLTDAAALPVKLAETPSGWSFAAGRPVAGVPLDHCFTGWDGRALLRWPGHEISLQASGSRFLHVYVPSGRDFFCIEPQSVATGAFNDADAAIELLAPGMQLSLTLDLRLKET